MKIVYKIFPMLLCLAVFGLSAQDPVASYPFGASANDVSGFDNHASVNGAYLTQDRFGVANNAFSFDGKNSFLAAPNAAHLNTDLASVSFWINVNKLPLTGESYPFSFGGWQERFKVSLRDIGQFRWTTNADGISDLDAGDGNEVQIGEWTHMVFVHDGAKDIIYMNSVMVAEKDAPGNLNGTDRPLGIGYDIYDGGSYFNGSMDEVLIYDGALTAQQIADLYAAQSVSPTFDLGVVADYTFSGNLRDGSTYANHARGTNAEMVTDRFGIGASAFSFDGETSAVTAANSAHLNSDYTTVSFWINVNNLPVSGEAYPLSFGGWQERWKVSLPSHGKIVWTTKHENGCCGDTDAGEGNELQPGVWTHVVMVHDGLKDKVFINGELKNQNDIVGKLLTTKYPLGIGYDPIDVANYFDGSLDDIMIFNYGLTDMEVEQLHITQSTLPYVPTELVADFKFTGDATDATQYGNHGVIDGAVTTLDRFGYGGNAYRFSGAESITASNSILYNSPYTTVSFWINVTELPLSGEVYPLSFGGWQERWKVSLPSHGKIVWTTKHENGCCGDTDAGAGNELQPGVWTHVAMVHDGLKDKVFINGELKNENDIVGELLTTKYPLGIGYDPIDVANYFNGALDEIQIYNLALSDQEIADLYAAQNTPPVHNETLVADYAFSGNALDETAFRNHGWVNGAILATDRFDRKNHSFDFDGMSAGITADNTTQLNSPHTTVSFWINVTELPLTGEAYPLSFGGWQERWKISLPSHGKIVWTTKHVNGCCGDTDAGEGNELQPGVWTHVAMVHDGLKDKVFINGVMANENDIVGDLLSTTYPLGIGYDPIDVANYFNGKLDDVQIYNYGMTDQEVADLFAAQSQAPVELDTEAPSAPLELTGVIPNLDANLFWWESTDNVGVTGYNVFQDNVVVMNTTNTFARISGLTQLTDYTFGVTALDAAGNESRMTTIQLTSGVDAAPDTIAPSVPANLLAAASSNAISFSWDPSTDNTAVAGYVSLLDGLFLDSLNANQTSVFVGGLDPLTLYTFEVYAYDFAGNNSEIAELTVSTEAPVVTAEEGLVAHYPFEGNADDATPYENHGVIGGNPTFEAAGSRPGMAIVFDGDQDSVLAPNAAQLISDFTTVSFWIRVDSINIDDSEAFVLDFGNWDQRWKISLPQHLKIVWTTNSFSATLPGGAIVDVDSGNGNEMLIGFWWYVTVVHDGVDNIVYVDGLEVNRVPAPGKLNSTGRPFAMGSGASFSGQYFSGALDEVKVYNKALTAEEIDKLFKTGTTGIRDLDPVLAGYVKMLYPNPGTDQMTLEHQFDGKQELLLRVFDNMGRQVDAFRYDRNQVAGGKLDLDLSTYHAGKYTLNFVLGGRNIGSMPFVKL